MIRRIVALLACTAALSLRAQPGEFTVSSDQSDSTDAETRLIGHARLSDGAILVTADEIRFDNQTRNVVTAIGHVVATRGATRILADRLVYHRNDGTFTADHVRLGAYPYYVAGESATGTVAEITIHHATATYGEPGPWQPSLTADKIIYAPGRQLRAENSHAGIGDVHFLPFPKFTEDLHESLISHVTMTGGFRKSLGAFVDAGVHLPTAPGLFLGADLALYTSRGILFGPAGSYTFGPGGAEGGGFLRSGFINDHGDKKTDLLGRPVPENRAFVEWQHTQQLTEHIDLDAQLNWWKDSEVLRDFRPRAFFPVQEPDTFVESTYTGRNFFVSAFARLQPNNFDTVQERLPELRFDLLPTAIGGGVYERFNASAAVLRETSPLGGPHLQSDRLDAYYALERPITHKDWFSFTPVAGARITRYSDSQSTAALLPVSAASPVALTAIPVTVVTGGSVPTTSSIGASSGIAASTGGGRSGPIPLSPTATYVASAATSSTTTSAPLVSLFPNSYTRVLGELGFDLALHASGTFDYKNDTWGIDGLRHLVTPRLSYRYIPEADHGRASIPPIDRQTFSTYLQPLGLGDVRNIDDLHATNTLRLELDNTIQTRDATYGSRDLLTLNFATDFQFKRLPGERPTSDVQTELAFAPARWLAVNAFTSVTPQDGTLQEFNSGFALHDGEAWLVNFSNNFLRRQIEDYHVDGRFRLNENYDAVARLGYDARKRRFNEQAYGLDQTLGHTWRVSYLVSFYSGPRRESHFGLNVQVQAIGF